HVEGDLLVAPAQVGAVDQAGAVGVEVGHEPVRTAVVGGVEGSRGGGEVERVGLPGDVGGAVGAHRDPIPRVVEDPSQERAVDQGTPVGGEGRGEGVDVQPLPIVVDQGVEGPGGGGEVGRTDISRGVYGAVRA